MADDIQVEEFSRGNTAQDDRLRPGDGGTAGGPNANADLREKGDADDIAEAVIQGDAETATREVGLRSDSPVDLTRNEIEENRYQSTDDSGEAAIIEHVQTAVEGDTPQQIDGLEFSSNDGRTNGARIGREQHTENSNVEIPAEGAPAPPVSASNGTASESLPGVPAAEIATENLAQTDETSIPDVQDFTTSGDSGSAQGTLTNPAASGNGGVGNGSGQGSANGQDNGVSGGTDAPQAPAVANGNNGNGNGNGNGNNGTGNSDGTPDNGPGTTATTDTAGTAADTGGTGGSVSEPVSGDTGTVATGGTAQTAGDTGGDTGGVATQPDVTGTGGSAGDTVAGDTATGTGGDAPQTDTGAATGGDTGSVATQPDTTGTGGDAPAGDTGDNGMATTGATGGGNADTDPAVEPVAEDLDLDGGNGRDTLEGDSGNDTLDGGNGKDVLNGGAGDDTLTGGNGNDTFAFDEGFGNDVISDFKPGNDQIDLSNVGVPDLPSLLANAEMDGNDTVITTDQGTLSDVDMNDLSADDFVFGDAPVTDSSITVDTGDVAGTPDESASDTATDTPAQDTMADTQPDATGTTGTGGDAPADDNTTVPDSAGNDPVTDGVDQVADTVTDTVGGVTAGADENDAGAADETVQTGGGDITGDTGTGATGDTAGTGGSAGDTVAGDTATGTGGDAPQTDTGAATSGDTGGVATQPDTTGTGGDGQTGGDTGGMATQPDTNATSGDIPAGDTGTSTNAGAGDSSGNDTTSGTGDSGTTAGDQQTGGSGDVPPVADTPVADTPVAQPPAPTIEGDSGSNNIDGSSGVDVVNAGSGSDTLDGGSGEDRLHGGSGDDIIDGGAGNDRVTGVTGNDTMSGGEGNDRLSGGSGSDTLDGGSGEDRLHGGSGDDIIDGGAGNDRVTGGTGNDTMSGGEGNDRLSGGSGNDVIDGGTGDDYLKGDAGADTFNFGGEFGNDLVRDFDVREGDSMDLSDTEIGDFRTLMDNSRQDGNNTVIELDGGTITLRDVDRNDLSSENFSFAEGAGMELSEPGSVHEIPDLPAFDSINARADGANGVAPDAVTVSSAQTVTMTFESESAGYQSSVGHYTVDADGVIQNVEMAWENASLEGSGGDLVGGESQVSFDVDAGARVGVFVVPNGHQQNDFSEMTDGHFEFRDDAGEPATINTPSPTLVFVHSDGNEITINSQSGEIFHSAGPDMHGDNLEHSVSGVNEAGDLMIGFEDLVGGGDRDYEDVVLKIEFEPKMDEAAPAPDSAFSDGSGGAGALDMVSTDFDFVDDVSDGQEAVFNLDFTDLIPEGADEGQFEVRVSGLPSQVSSSKGEVDSDRNWTLTMMQVVGLTIAVPTFASAADLLDDINFQVVDTQSDQVVAEGKLDSEALNAGETTISVLPQIAEEDNGPRGKARGHDKQEEKAAAEEAQAAEEATQPAVEDPAPADAVHHAPAGAAVPPVVEQVLPEQAAEQAVEAVAAVENTGGHGNGRGRGAAEVNVAPTDLVLDTSLVLENAANGAVVGTVSATDANSGDSFTYSLVDDANGRFAIDPNTGRITVADASQLDYETDTSHNLTVKVTDSGGNTYDEVMTINIGDVGDPPTGASVLTFAVGENSWFNGAALNGSVNVTDADAGDTFTFSMVDDAGGRFSIDADGTIRVADKSLLDYETSTSHNITFRITDSTGNTYDHTHTIHLYDENDTPTDLTLTANTVAENAANGTIIGTVSATDQDAGETFTYSLVNDQGGRFAIDTNTGVVTVADGSKLDYETLSAHNIQIRVTDSGGATYTESMAINLTNVNETPTDLKLTNVEIAEGAANGIVVGTAAATDADSGETFTYSLTDNAGGRFTIDGATGQITVADGSLLDYETATSHDVTVRVTDSGGNTYDETYTIEVNDEREQTNTLEAEVVSHGPVGYWQMDEVNSYGTHTFAPAVGDVDMTAVSTATGELNKGIGNISGNTTYFNTNDYAVIADDPAWQLTDGTIQVWTKVNDKDRDGAINDEGVQTIVSRDANGTGEGHFYLNADGNDLEVRLQGTNGGTLNAGNVLTPGVVHQINVTFGTTGLEIWVDGNRVAHDPTITGGIDGNNEPWVLGGSNHTSTAGGTLDALTNFFDGRISEFAIFDSQLSSAVINDIYDAGVNGHDSVASGSTTGNDMIHGTSGNDSLGGHNGDDFIYGGDGDDTIDGGAGNDVISGGAGTDTVDYSGFGAGFGVGATVNLTTGTATDSGGSTDTLSGFENVLGTAYADDITGNDADNVLTGNAGNDTLRGEDGDDTLYGGAGNDTLTGGAGDDLFQGGSGADNMDGGAGTDTVTYAGAANGVTVNLATGTATDGVGDTDTLSNIENIIGSANNDTFTGNGSVNELTGGDGSDRFIMGEGGTMDTIHGGIGGSWTDTLQLLNVDSSAVGGGWTVQLTSGSVQSDDGSTMTLSNDAAGTVTLEDGSQIALDGLERIEY